MAELSRHFKSRSDLVLESSLLRFFFFFSTHTAEPIHSQIFDMLAKAPENLT